MIYSSPMNKKSASLWALPGGNLWEKFEVITLKTNHRQGNNRSYADVLNRIRIGKKTDEDLSMLGTRIFPRNSGDLPKDALLVTGENRIVQSVNEKRISELPGELFEVEAEVSSRTRGKYKPKIDKSGQVKNTPLQKILKLKKNARIMLTMNLDVCDSLANGALGKVVDFVKKTNGELQYILVKFDNEDVGKEYRKKINFDRQYPGENLTAIKKIEFDFQLREGGTSTATAINFPLRLAWATTCHKIQGHTVKNPEKLMLDLKCWLQPAMVYVALSRVQCLDQLYILEELPEDKIKPWQDALEEMDRLDALDKERETKEVFRICSMNTRSLQSHFDDIIRDNSLLLSSIICIQETWLQPEDNGMNYQIEGKTCYMNNVRRGAGISTYCGETFIHLKDITALSYQITAIESEDMRIINIYRSCDANNVTVKKALQSLFHTNSKSIIISGDWNFCHRDEYNHPVYQFLIEKNFVPVRIPPQATHREGRCLDMIWTGFPDEADYKTWSNFVYYTDHGQQFLSKHPTTNYNDTSTDPPELGEG